MERTLRYFTINKPYNMVSQFVSPDPVRLLGELDFDFPEGIHAIGRLDSHSEGLLLLTTDKRVTRLLFESERPHKRTYLVQVRREVSDEALQRLREGVEIRTTEATWYKAVPVSIERGRAPEGFEELYPHYRPVPHSWLLITLTEGKYHQVRKMVQAVQHPCKRLIRISIEQMELGDLKPGEVREWPADQFFRLLNIEVPEVNGLI